MKKRVVSALVAAILLIPILLIGGNLYKVGVLVLGVIALYELIHARESKKNIPLLMKLFSILMFIIELIANFSNETFTFILPSKYIILLIIGLLLGLIVYEDEKKYNVEDACYLAVTNIFLTISFSLLLSIREYNIYYLIIILLITIVSDTFALIVGSLIGSHKLCPKISPNKTVEGLTGGLLFCLAICVPTYITLTNYTGSIVNVVLLILLLSILSTFGDLVFSSIKRYFDIKDYGKIMPGHGGAMDRLDSLLFVLLAFYILFNLI